MNEPIDQSVADLMTIGRFSQASRLSLKALRLYDALGLLPPAYVDPDSSYRYYAAAQLRNARLIGLLRRLGMPLERIARVLELSGTEASQEVAAFGREVEAEAVTKRKLVRYLEGWLEGKGEEMYEVKTREVPEQKVLSVQRNVFAEDLPSFIEEAMGALYEHLTETGLEAAGVCFVVYHREVNEDSDGPVEVCVPFTGSAEPVGEMHVRLEPAHREAFTRITKGQVAFPGILKAYDAVHSWTDAHNATRSAPPREVYFADWNAVSDDEPACDIAWPVE